MSQLIVMFSFITKPKSLLSARDLRTSSPRHLRNAASQAPPWTPLIVCIFDNIPKDSCAPGSLQSTALGDVTQFNLCSVVKTLLLAWRVFGGGRVCGGKIGRSGERITEHVAPTSAVGASITAGRRRLDGSVSAPPPSVLFTSPCSGLLSHQMIFPSTLRFTRNFRNPPRPISASVPFMI